MITLADLFFWRGADNETGLPNITGTELAALISAQGAGPNAGASVGCRRAASFSVPVGFSGYIVDYDAGAVFDDLGFFNGAAPTRLTIPVTDPPISRVLLTAMAVWSPTAPADSAFYAQILRPSRVTLLESQQTVNGQGGTAITSFCNTTYIEEVVPGDYFELRAYHLLSSTNVNLARATFSLTVLR